MIKVVEVVGKVGIVDVHDDKKVVRDIDIEVIIHKKEKLVLNV